MRTRPESFTTGTAGDCTGRNAQCRPACSKDCAGPTPAACELLDGLFLAARRPVLRANNVLFDPAFDFHFYDLDFCRTARAKGLRLGTWPIALTHQSNPLYGNPQWSELFLQYCEKWEPLY